MKKALILLATCFVLAGGWLYLSNDKPPASSERVIEYVVKSGDTKWDISERYYDLETYDFVCFNEFYNRLCVDNGEVIHPGDVVKVRYYVK